MTKPVLDADGMAEHLKGVSQADWPQLIELWRLQQYAAGHRDAEDARKRAIDEQRQFAAGREAGVRETEERLAPAATDYYDDPERDARPSIHHWPHISPAPDAPCKHEWRQYMKELEWRPRDRGFFHRLAPRGYFCIHCTERKD